MGVAKNGRMCYILWRKKLNDNGGKKCQNRYHLISVRLTTKKIDIWKLPWIAQNLLGGVKGSSFVKSQLREIMEWCHVIDPQQRPTGKEVLQELLRVQQLIVTNSSYIYCPFSIK